MISKEILEKVRIGILTDAELKVAIKHYKVLEEHLKCHGEIYQLVYRHVRNELDRLQDYHNLRKADKKIENEIKKIAQSTQW